MIRADVPKHVTAMTVSENRSVGSKERPGGAKKQTTN